MFSSRCLALALLVLATVSSGARADFQPLTSPGMEIVGFAAGGPNLAALVSRPAAPRLVSGARPVTARVSHDGGATWADAPLPGVAGAGVRLGPDGFFWTTVATPGAPARLARMPATGSAFTAFGPPLPDSARLDGYPPAAPIWDAGGRMWVLWPSAATATWIVARLDAVGGVAASWPLSPLARFTRSWPELVAGGDGLYARTPGPNADAIAQVDAAGPVPVPSVATWVHGSALADGCGDVSFAGVPLDATVEPAEGAAVLGYRGRLMVPAGPELWADTGVKLPAGANRVIAHGDGLLAVSDLSHRPSACGVADEAPVNLARHSGPLAGAGSRGPLNASAGAILAEANRLRVEAGFPALVGDPLLSRAAENHSRYVVANRLALTHDESPGRPGFTGAAPWDRCAAVGTTCTSEIAASEMTAAAAVRTWIATIYHRPLLMDPEGRVVGAGQVAGGPAIVDGYSRDSGRAPEGNLQIGPIGYPRGRYSGDLGFSDEVPDPGARCGNAISPPYGAAVTLFAPGPAKAVVTRLSGPGGRAIKGCSDQNAFVPDDALAPGTTYTASGRWGARTPTIPFRWTFRTAGAEARAPAGCRAQLVLPRARRLARLRVGYVSCGPSTLRIDFRRPRSAKVSLKRAVRIAPAQRGSVTVRPGLGRWSVTVRLGRAKTTRAITVTRS